MVDRKLGRDARHAWRREKCLQITRLMLVIFLRHLFHPGIQVFFVFNLKVLNRHCLWPLRKILGVTNVLKSFYSSDSLELCGCSVNKWVQLTERLMVSLALERMAGHWGPGGWQGH